MNALGPPLEVTRIAEIFSWANGRRLKLFNADLPENWAEYEAKVLRLAHAEGLPVPRVDDVVEHDGRVGIVMEAPRGDNLLRLAARRPWKAREAARRLAEFQARIHRIEPPEADFPGQLEWGQNQLNRAHNLTESLKEKVWHILDCLPEGRSLCHGNFHPGNVFVDEKKEEGTVVDWIAAYRGPGISDLARTSVLLEAANPPVDFGFAKLLERARRKFHDAYVDAYFDINPGGRELFGGWRAVMGAGFLPYTQPNETPVVLRIVQDGIEDFKANFKPTIPAPPPPPGFLDANTPPSPPSSS